METFKGIMYIALGIGGFIVTIIWGAYLIKQFWNIGKEVITENAHKKNELKICPNGHMYKNSNKCPYCSKLKDFNLPKRELNLAEIRTYFQSYKNFNEYINDTFIHENHFDNRFISKCREIYISYNKNFPIKGGWGYTVNDAIIIDLANSYRSEQFAYEIAKIRLYFELFMCRKSYDISEISRKETLYSGKKEKYYVLLLKHICFSQTDYEELDNDLKRYENNPTDYNYDFLLEHNKKRVSLMYHVNSEFFFDVTKGYV